MLASPFTAGVGISVFYALQPYLLELWGDDQAYTVAGLAAALLSGASILGGALSPWVRKLFHRRPSTLPLATVSSAVVLLEFGLVRNSWVRIALVTAWGIASAIDDPVHRAYLNDTIPSKERVADVGGYGASMLWGGVITAIAIPFMLLGRGQHSPADTARDVGEHAQS
ncbi:hypothetical protein BH10ACT5_BH10ACT5_04050 [soil metagenome]|jgi:MFS family permease